LTGASLAEQLRADLASRLAGSERFVTAGNRQEADAVFQGSVSESEDKLSVTVRLDLVDPAGHVIWSFAKTGKHEQFANMANQIVKELMKDSRRNERR
jgi:TolB-like protein